MNRQELREAAEAAIRTALAQSPGTTSGGGVFVTAFDLIRLLDDLEATERRDAMQSGHRARLEAWFSATSQGDREPEPLFDIAEDAVDELDRMIARAEAAERERDELRPDADMLRRIRKSRQNLVGTACGCEFDDNDNPLQTCAYHAEVVANSDVIGDLRRKLAIAGVEGSPPPGEEGIIPKLQAENARLRDAIKRAPCPNRRDWPAAPLPPRLGGIDCVDEICSCWRRAALAPEGE